MSRIVVATTMLALAAIAPAAAAAETGEKFLGKSAEQWAGELKSEAAAVRHHAAWALAQMGGAAGQPPAAALAHGDPTVRFWGVFGLARIADKEPDESPARARLAGAIAPLLGDKSAAVRVAAAEALVRLGGREAGLAALVASLADPQEAVRIQAIDSLEKLGPLAAPARGEIEKATSDTSEYVKRISARILKR